MGNDGGSIPDRTSMIKVKKKKKKLHNREIKTIKCNLCSLTKEKLRKPIVGDKIGQLYNKTSVIKYLLSKNKPSGFHHIKSLNNIKELNCVINDNGYIQCQISREEFSGLNKFYFLWTCGCVISKTAIDELHMKEKCIICDNSFDLKKDLISLNYNKRQKIEIQKELLGIKKTNNEKNDLKKITSFKLFEDKEETIKADNNFLKKKTQRNDNMIKLK